MTGRFSQWSGIVEPYYGLIGLLFAAQIGQAIASLVLPSLSADIIDNGILADDTAYILRQALVMLAAALTQIVFAVATVWLGARIAIDIGHDLRAAIFSHVQDFSLTELRHFGVPSLITRTTNDVQQLQVTLVMFLTMVMTAPITGIGAVIMAIRQDAFLSLVLLVSVPLLCLIVGVILMRGLPLFTRMQGLIDGVNRILREQIGGVRTIRAFVRDDHERARFAGANEELTSVALRVGRLMALNMPAAMLVMNLTSIGVIWVGGHRIAGGQMEVGALVAYISYITLVLISVMIASMLFVMAPRAIVSAGRIREVLETPPTIMAPQRISKLSAVPQTLGEVEFRNVSFAYPGAEVAILHDISFRIRPGETVGVIGATGSGKSTLLNLIPRLFDVTSGGVLVNGKDVRDYELEDLWSLIGLVPQEAYLFSGTVRENLRYGRADASDPDLWHALEVAQARDFVMALPGALDAPVAQGGGNFSGGQRQRLTIARALVRNPAICLFDDSFSALDYATDARLRTALARGAAGSATLIVGQRVNSLCHADRILVLDRGAVVGQGSHDELLRSCAEYAEIVESQNFAEAVP